MNDTNNTEVTMYLLVRTDLRMSKGKMCAQAGHATHLVIRAVELSPDEESKNYLKTWEEHSYPKIALNIPDEDTLMSVCKSLSEQGVIFTPVVDEGRTEITPNTVTAVGVQPLPRSLTKEILGHLRLL